MGVIKKFNPETNRWEIYGSTEAKDIKLIDISDNFETKDVESALREISEKLNESIAYIDAHSQTLTEHTENIEWLIVNGGGGSGGGGGGGSIIPTITSKFEDGTIVQKDEDVKIPFFFSSPSLGNGTVYVMINGIEVMSFTDIKQGNNTINIGKLTELRNNISIYVKDRAGLLSNQLEWLVICGGLEFSLNFDYEADYSITDIITMQYTVSSIGEEPIILHLKIDYDEYEIISSNGVNTYTFQELGVGIHEVEMYLTSGEYITPVTKFNMVVINANSLYVSSTFIDGTEFTYGTPVTIQYRISKATQETFTVKLYLNDELDKTMEATAGTYYWTLNNIPVGAYTAKIEVTSAFDEFVSVTKTFQIVKGEYVPLKVVENGLIYRLNAFGRTNQDTDKTSPKDDSGNGVITRLHNFNYYTNGWIDGELVCNGEAYVEIDLYPWLSNAIYGSTIEIHYTSLDVGIQNARVFDYTDINAPYKGIYVDLEETSMKSLANTGTLSIDKDADTTLTFVIDRTAKFGKIFINGICSRAFSLSDSGSGVNAVREDFTHSQKIYLNSKKGKDSYGACNIKDVRIYNRTLTDDEIVNNYISQITDLEEQEKIYNFNYHNTSLPRIDMYGDTTNMTLETPVTMRIKYTSPNEDKYGQSFDLPYCQVNWQGTSSLQYVLKNFTARLRDENMAEYFYTPYPNGVKESVFCFKADYMESSHSRNVGIAKFVNECLYDSKTPVQMKNSKIRNTVDGFPCLMYINNELQGVYNFNLDRYSTLSYGYTDPTNCLVYEVSANSDTTAGAFYKWSETSGKSELNYYKSDFECLYPPTRASGNDDLAELIRLIEWVDDSSDEVFRDNIRNYFDLEYLLRYYLFVLIFGAVDSLGKNMKLASFDGGRIWYPQVYDADKFCRLIW